MYPLLVIDRQIIDDRELTSNLYDGLIFEQTRDHSANRRIQRRDFEIVGCAQKAHQNVLFSVFCYKRH